MNLTEIQRDNEDCGNGKTGSYEKDSECKQIMDFCSDVMNAQVLWQHWLREKLCVSQLLGNVAYELRTSCQKSALEQKGRILGLLNV
jgi:hypothetical protein